MRLKKYNIQLPSSPAATEIVIADKEAKSSFCGIDTSQRHDNPGWKSRKIQIFQQGQ